jgi:hypothetical protein
MFPNSQITSTKENNTITNIKNIIPEYEHHSPKGVSTCYCCSDPAPPGMAAVSVTAGWKNRRISIGATEVLGANLRNHLALPQGNRPISASANSPCSPIVTLDMTQRCPSCSAMFHVHFHHWCFLE